MTPDRLHRAREQLAPYGYTLTGDGFIVKANDQTTGFRVTRKGPRYHVRNNSGTLYFSGPDVGVFVAEFWYAKRQAA